MDLSFKPKVWLFIMLVVGIFVTWLFQGQLFRFSMFDSEDTSIRRILAERWAQRASVVAASDERLASNRQSIQIARVVNDHDGVLTQQLKQWIGRRNVTVKNGRWYHDWGYTTGWNSEPSTIEDSVKESQSAGADYIVAAEIENWTTFPDFDRELSGWLQIHDGDDGRLLKRVNLSTSEGSLPNRQKAHSVGVADQYSHAEARSQIPVNGRYRQTVVKPKLELADVARPDLLFGKTGSDLLKPSTETDSNSSIDLERMRYLGIGLWVFSLMGIPWLLKRKISRTLRKNSNYENGRQLLFWVIGVSVSTFIVWASWLPISTAMIIAALVTIFACIYFGFCCRWIAVQ